MVLSKRGKSIEKERQSVVTRAWGEEGWEVAVKGVGFHSGDENILK